jgi:hypothetical protein
MRRIIPYILLFASLPCIAQVVANDPTAYGRCHNNDVLTKENRAKSENAELLKLAIRITSPCNMAIVEQYVQAHPPQFSATQAEALAQQLLTYAEQARQDTQVGASANSAGTTSLVSKGVGALVGVALESGSINRTTSGNVTTVTINSAQAAQFLSAGNIKPCALIESCGFGRKLLSGLTVVTTYDVSQANTSTNSTPAQAALTSLVGSNDPAFTGVSARVDFHARKKFDPNSAIAISTLATAYQKGDYLAAAATYASAYNSLIVSIDDPNNHEYQTAITNALAALKDTATNDTDAKVTMILTNLQLAIVNIINQNAPATLAFQTYASAERSYHGERDVALGAVLNKWTASFEYDFDRLANQPDQSDFKGIYSYRSDANNSEKILQFTANAGATIYNNLLGSSTSHFRSAQAALQLDYTATSAASKIQTAVSGGYYFQYMVADGLLTLPSSGLAPGTAIPLPGDASQLLNTTGPIHIGQGKVTLSIKGTNINIPLALTFSNRTDLIKASKVGGNFGITYDFSSLLATLKN